MQPGMSLALRTAFYIKEQTMQNDALAEFFKIINLWNWALFKGATAVFGNDAPYVFREAGRAAIDKLKTEGIDLIKDTPAETINAIYDYLTKHGFFEEAHATLLTEKDGDGAYYEVREKGCAIIGSSLCALHSGTDGTKACPCYNMLEYALNSKFDLDLKLEKNEVKHRADGELINLKLVHLSEEQHNAITLSDELRVAHAETAKIAQKYKGIVDAALDAIVSCDDLNKITIWNVAAEKMFGYTTEEAFNMSLDIIIPDDQREMHRTAIARFVQSEKPVLIGKITEIEALKKDGSTFQAEMSLSASKNNDMWHFTAIIRDITERKRLEISLQERIDELNKLNKFMINREVKMEDLRKEIRELRAKISTLERKKPEKT
ncbi:PAS domain S-box protein [bacterium]|nr:MAG: PAS domain S-box protein [bacterium]